ncbi:MAG: DUF4286 family protein [Phycisphaerae bacterium]|nr:DUF4286 family protein [Phycisphaerae bacterium]
MPAIAYTVVASFPDLATRDEYIAWLEDGHIDAVIRHGAHAASIIRITEPPSPVQVEVRYTFSTRDLYDIYIRDYAPALRSEGLRRFPPARGISFSRRTGEIL